MALDKLVDSTQLDADLTTVANAIRAKGGTSAQLSFPSGMAAAIAAISGGGGLTPTDTYTFTEAYSTRDDLWELFKTLVSGNTDPLAIWIREDFSAVPNAELSVVAESNGQIYYNTHIFRRYKTSAVNTWLYSNASTSAPVGKVMKRYVIIGSD